MSNESPSLPDGGDWLQWGVEVVKELHAGKQSRVFDAFLNGRRVALKLTESHLTDQTVLTSRLEAVEALGPACPNVIQPLRIHGALVQPIGEWLLTATSFIEGNRLDAGSASDAETLGRTLAALHAALRRLDPFQIPPIAALDTTGRTAERYGWQLLHGDFSSQNTIATPTMIRVFDFDDCGYGPVAYDLANSLYMVLFDSEITKRPALYETFRPAFLSGYADGTGRAAADIDIDIDIDIDEMIATRIEALGLWLNDLTSAPIGIRTSSPEWLETLASFVDAQRWNFGRFRAEGDAKPTKAR